MNAIEISNLSKAYRDFTLENFSLVLPSGCIMGLVGENGAGKTTVIKLILGMLKSDGGSVKIFGRDNRDNFELIKEDIGVVLDDVGIPGCLNAAHVGKIMKNTFKNWDGEAYSRYLKQMKIPEKTAFKELSRGMKMKLGIAVALSHDAKLLILDEATSGLDPVVRDEVLDIFNEFTRSENHSILISSHIVSDLEKICDYIAFMKNGRLILCEEKDRIIEQYALVNCTAEEIEKFAPSAVIGKKATEYGVSAIVRRSEVPQEQPGGQGRS